MRRYMGFPFHGKISVGECVAALKSSLPVFSKKVTPLSVLNSRPQHIFRFASADYREYMRRFLSHVFPFYLLKLFVVRRAVWGEGPCETLEQGHAQCNADDPQQKTLHVLLLLCSKKAHPRSLWSDCRCASFVSGVWFILQHPRQVPLRQLPARPFLHRPRQRADARTRPVPFRGGAGKQPQQPVLRQQRPGQ